jgi:predicted nucleic acid-binding protein
VKKVFADTSFLVAFYNKSDGNHTKAREFMKLCDKITFIITDYIFDEFLTVLLVRGNKLLSIEAGEKILKDNNFSIIKVDNEVFQKAWIIYQSFKDKNWSFTDCTSYVLMKNLSIDTGLSFDEHFKQFGFKIMP